MEPVPNGNVVPHSASNDGSQNGSTPPAAFSWLQPHTIFVVILVGPEEVPFALQKDLLCAKSKHFADHFVAAAPDHKDTTLEHVVNMPDASAAVFGLAQNYMYTREVWPDDGSVPSYEDLFDLWRLGSQYGIHGLCDKTLECMEEVKERTRQIPGTAMISKVWGETTGENGGSPVRRLLLQWVEEYFKSSSAPSDFARTLPQEFLSELVVEMSAFTDVARAVPVAPAETAKPNGVAAGTSGTAKSARALEGSEAPVPSKRARTSKATTSGRASGGATGPAKKAGPKRKASNVFMSPRVFTDTQKVYYCSDLLSRMLSGPGYWTRMVKPFRHPVDPIADGVPDYFERIPQPMDLLKVKSNMDKGLYTTPEQFAEDVRLIVRNCQTYWSPTTPLYADAEKFGKAFEEKFADMDKWLTKMIPEEGA